MFRICTHVLLGSTSAILLAMAALAAPLDPPYKISDPASPAVWSQWKDSEKNQQRLDGVALVRAISDAISSGKPGFTMQSHHVYRIPGSLYFPHTQNFTLSGDDDEIILESNAPFFWFDTVSGITVQGAAPDSVRFDYDPPLMSQGTVTAYNDASGMATIQMMPGYTTNYVGNTGRGGIFTPDGTWTGDAEWAGNYAGAIVNPATGTATLNVGSRKSGLYALGNIWSASTAGFAVECYIDCHNLTLKNLSFYGGGGLAGGVAASGTLTFDGLVVSRRPNTSRVVGGAAPQAGFAPGSKVLIENSNFGISGDDDMNMTAESPGMVYQQADATHVLIYGYGVTTGTTLSFLDPSSIHIEATVGVVASSTIIDPAAIAAAAAEETALDQLSPRAFPVLQNVTLSKPVRIAAGSMALPAGPSSSITLLNDYFHDASNAVATKGFSSVTVKQCVFSRIAHAGIDVVYDQWWWEGGFQGNVTISSNSFTQSPFASPWNPLVGAAAIEVGPSTIQAPTEPNFSRSVVITGNTISSPAFTGIEVRDATNVRVEKNSIDTPYLLKQGGSTARYYGDADEAGIFLFAVRNATVDGNTVVNSSGPDIIAGQYSSNVAVTNNISVRSHSVPAYTQGWADSSAIILFDSVSGATSSGNQIITPGPYADLGQPIKTEQTASTAFKVGVRYTIINSSNGLILDSLGASVPGSPVVQSKPVIGDANQQWFIVPGQIGWTLRNAGTGLMIDNVASLSKGSRLVMNPFVRNFLYNQDWKIVPTISGEYMIVSAYSQEGMDDGNATAPGALLTQYTWSPGNQNQNWLLSPS